jgi:hypothetical protein
MSTLRDENGQLKLQPFKEESGQVLVLTVLCCTVFLGFMALALDVGLLFRAKRNLQVAADSAATAAALDYYYYGNADDANAVGRKAASLDNVTDGVNGTSVVVNYPVVNGVYAGKTGYFEVIVKQPNPTIFMGIFQRNSVTVATRAVAGTPYASTYCVDALATKGTLGNGKSTGTSTMLLQGSFDIEALKCGIAVNGNSTDAIDFGNTTGKANLNAGSISVVGGCNGATNCPTGSTDGGAATVATGVAPVQDPLQSISNNPPPTTSCSAPTGGNLTGNIGSAGVTKCYSGPVAITGPATLAGTLVFTGPVTFDGVIGTAASGTTIDIASNSTEKNPALTFKSTATMSLDAPSTGPYAGIVLMSPAQYSGTLKLQFGASCAHIDGIIYAPSSELYFQDSGCDNKGGLTITSDIIVGTFQDDTATIKLTSYSQTHNGPLKAVALVE